MPTLDEAVAAWLAGLRQSEGPSSWVAGPLGEAQALVARAQGTLRMHFEATVVVNWLDMPASPAEDVVVQMNVTRTLSGVLGGKPYERRATMSAARWNLLADGWRVTDVYTEGAWASTRTCLHPPMPPVERDGYTWRPRALQHAPNGRWRLLGEFAAGEDDRWVSVTPTSEPIDVPAGGTVCVLTPARDLGTELSLSVRTGRGIRARNLKLSPLALSPNHPREGWCGAP